MINRGLGCCLVIVLGLTPIEGVFAWEIQAHQRIVLHAIEVLPGPLKEALQAVERPLVYGVAEPDYNRVDDHKIRLSTVRGSRVSSVGGAHFALERFATQAEETIRRDGLAPDAARAMGQAAHFIQDLNVPLHTLEGEGAELHAAYERIAYFDGWPGDKFGYRGFLLVKKYKCFAFETAQRSHGLVDQALRLPPSQDLIEKTWNDAVNDTANLWQSIVYRAVGAEKAQALYGISPPKGEVGKGWLC